MKQIRGIFTLVLTIFVALIAANPVNAKTTTLEDVAKAFNESKSIKSIGELLEWKSISASYVEEEPNVLSISITDNEDFSSSISYELNGNILSYDHLVEDNYLTAYLVAESVNQVKGRKDGETLENINMFADEFEEFTVEGDGFELNQNDSYYSVKIDINKGITLLDVKSFYLKPTDFEIVKRIIDNKTMGNQTGKATILAYDVIIDDDKIEIFMGEDGELGDSAYRSILSVIEVIYGKRGVEYFKDKYSSFDEGNVDYDGFALYVDYDIDDVEETVFNGTAVAKLTIDRKYFEDVSLRTEFIGETVDGGEKAIDLNLLNNKSYKVGLFDNVKSNDIGYLIKYILTPAAEVEHEDNDEDNVIYFNVVNGKVVLGDKDNSIFKVVINTDDYTAEIVSTKNDEKKTTLTLIYDDLESKEYKECEYGHNDHVRYVKNDVTLNITYGTEKEYKVLEGANQTVNTKKDDKLSFRLDIDYNEFLESGVVYIDGEEVESSNYTTEEGSTIITFNDDFVKTLSNSTHTLKVEVNDGEVTTSFKVTDTISPQTGDNVIYYIVLSIVSVLGIVLVKVFSKKKAKPIF